MPAADWGARQTGEHGRLGVLNLSIRGILSLLLRSRIPGQCLLPSRGSRSCLERMLLSERPWPGKAPLQASFPPARLGERVSKGVPRPSLPFLGQGGESLVYLEALVWFYGVMV